MVLELQLTSICSNPCCLGPRPGLLGLWAPRRPLLRPRSASHSRQSRPHSTQAAPKEGALSVVGGRTTPAPRNPTTTNLQAPTWMLLGAQQTLSLAQPRARAAAERTGADAGMGKGKVERALADRDLGEDEGSAAGRAPSWCVAYLLGQWMAASLPFNASSAADGSTSQCRWVAGGPPPARGATYGHLG